jgi:hypothetical protein
MDENVNKQQIATEVMKVINDIEQESATKSLIQDNTITFDVADKTYKMHLPTPLDKKGIEQYRRTKYLEFIQDERYLFKKQWIQKYLAKGIDIKAKETQLVVLQQGYKDLLLRLATTTNIADIDVLKKALNQNKQERYEMTVEISNLLSDSIESAMLIAVNIYTAYAVTEVKDGETWKPAFASVTELELNETELFATVLYYLNALCYPGNDIYELANTPKIS